MTKFKEFDPWLKFETWLKFINNNPPEYFYQGLKLICIFIDLHKMKINAWSRDPQNFLKSEHIFILQIKPHRPWQEDQVYVTSMIQPVDLVWFFRKKWVLPSSSDFLTPISLEPNLVDIRYFKLWILLKKCLCLKYLRFTLSGCKDKGIRKSEYVA